MKSEYEPTVGSEAATEGGFPTEESQAAREFAALIKSDAVRLRRANESDRYEIRPCARVRGYVLRLPVTRWTFWYPTAAAALNFARRLTCVYQAECFVFDGDGRLEGLPMKDPDGRASTRN